MKDVIKKIKKFIAHYKYETAIALFGLVTFIVGIFIIGILKTILIFIILACILVVIPILIKMYKRKKNLTKALIEEKLDDNLLENNINNYYEEINSNVKELKEVNKEGVFLKKKKVSKNKKISKNKKKKIFKIILLTFLIMFIIVLILIGIFFYSIVKDAPKVKDEDFYSQESTIIYDKDGNEITRIGSEMREKVSYNELPEVLIDAIIATEDSRFFQHNGFDLPRFLKASLGQVAGRDSGGASTLTMQLAKNDVTNEKYNMAASGLQGIKRKFTDIYVSIFEIEKKYTKKEILALYLNSYYLGSGCYGVGQASLTYFGKEVKDLTLPEAAMIAGLFQSPSGYDPYINPEAAEDRRQTVLYLMKRHGYITEEEEQIALQMPVETLLVGYDKTNEYQSFIDTVLAEVEEDTGFDPYTTPMLIYTTMDRAKQEHIDNVMNNKSVTYAGETFKWKDDNIEAGIVITDVTNGAIVAIGGGRNKTGAKSFNYATMIKNQIGSTSKPIYDYGPSIEFNNTGSGTIIIDDKYSYGGGGNLNNYDKKYLGAITMRRAIEDSRNVPALKTFQSVENSKIKEYVTSFGLHPELEGDSIHEAHSIGGYTGESPLNMAAAYAVYANGGYYIEPYSYTKIIYRDDNREYIPTEHGQKTRVVSEATSFIITNILCSTAQPVTGRSYINGIPIAAKSGTTDFSDKTMRDYKLPSNAVHDYWIVGYSPNYTVAMWLGYDDIEKGYNTSASNKMGLWRYIANGVITKGSKSKFPTSNDVVSVQIEKDCYGECVASEFTPSDMQTTEYFKKGTAPSVVSTRFAKLDNVTNLKYDVNDKKITLTWDYVKTPDMSDETYITNYYNELYINETMRDKRLTETLDYNRNNVGTIIYQIYLKDALGEYVLLDTTSSNTYTYDIFLAGNYEFMVKTTYTIFKANASDGAIINIPFNPSVIVVDIKGNKNITYNIGSNYVEQGIIVTENDMDVTDAASYTIKIIDSNNNTISTIPSDKVGTYKIEYKIIYKDKPYTVNRTVTYQ